MDPLKGHPGIPAGYLLGLEKLEHTNLPLLRDEVTHQFQQFARSEALFQFKMIKDGPLWIIMVLTDSIRAVSGLADLTEASSDINFLGHKVWLGSRSSAQS